MFKLSQFCHVLLATLVSFSFAKTVNAEPTATLNVVVNGVHHQKGEICFRVYASEQGFPMNNSSGSQSGCARITGNSVKKQFTGLKPGTYAVAVVDDQNGDRKLNKDFFGIPKEGFGISKNPTVSIQTGSPKFRDASFVVNKNTTVNIIMKYSLDS
ncbi:DUF2141 domain-containing protein [uncultured Nostoc sp.]|uniref:DUF2141 domain-containing protein n=1 Tax=uncultured Nostoc sp. TaxID=340711 RepID=UPI0035CB87DD